MYFVVMAMQCICTWPVRQLWDPGRAGAGRCFPCLPTSLLDAIPSQPSYHENIDIRVSGQFTFWVKIDQICLGGASGLARLGVRVRGSS